MADPATPLSAPLPRGTTFELHNVRKTFTGGGGIFIDKLALPAGRVIAVMGLSGTGKSTLLNLLGGIVPADPVTAAQPATLRLHLRGNGAVKTYDLAGPDRGRSFDEFGYVFQNAHLLRNATGLMNMAVAFRSLGQVMPLDELVQEARAVELRPELLSKRARQLSGGEKQRAAIGRGIVRNPQILLADEPTANLDPQNGLRIMGTICRWQRAKPADRTVIWVTHNVMEASIFADEIVLLEPGAAAADPGRLMAWKDSWPDRPPAAEGPAGSLWPMANPHHPRRLAAMLFNAAEIPVPSEAGATTLKWVRDSFVDRSSTHDPRQAAAIATAMQEAATGLATTAASLIAPAEAAPAPASALPAASGLRAARVGRWTVSRIGLAELFSAPRADTIKIPRRFATLIGAPRALQGTLASTSIGSRLREFSGWWLAGLALIGVAVLSTLAAVPGPWNWLMPVAGAACIGLALVRSAVRFAHNAGWGAWAFASSFQMLIFAAIASFLYALVLARDAVQASFDSSLRSLELSHTVVSYRGLVRGAQLDPKLIESHDALLKSKIDPELQRLDNTWTNRVVRPLLTDIRHGAAALEQKAQRLVAERLDPQRANGGAEPDTPVAGGAAPSRGPLAFGRWVQQGQNVRWPLKTVFAKPSDFDPDEVCLAPDGDKPPTLTNASFVVMRTSEPALRQMQYRAGPSLAALVNEPRPPGDFARLLGDDNDDVKGVIVTDGLLDRLQKKGELPAAAPLGRYLCIYGAEKGTWRLVRIAGIVTALPKEDLIAALDVMVPFELREEVNSKRPTADFGGSVFDVEAIYFADPRLIELYKDYFTKDLPGQGTVLPDAFGRIQKGLDTSKALTDFVDYILWGVLVFATLLVGLLTSFFISQNEKSLCVMRAFGVRLRHIIGLVLMQMLLVWGLAIALTAGIGSVLVAGPAQDMLIGKLRLPADALQASGGGWLEQLLLMTLAVVVASTLASAAWWWATPAVGDRLKELD